MIIAIERTKFNYIYKYNLVRVDINQLINKSSTELKLMQIDQYNRLLDQLNDSLPLFEQDHEIILLEVDKSKLEINNGILIPFDSIQCIYPLTKTGAQLILGKINDDFILESPFLEKAIESLKIIRSMDFRRNASKKLLEIYNLNDLLNNQMLEIIENSVKKNLLDKTYPQELNSFLDHLIAYNKNPSYIPEGNIEFICKIGVVAIKYLTKPEEVFTNGPFYKSCLNHKAKINSSSIFSSFISFKNIADPDLTSSVDKMVEIISRDFYGFDIFKASYFFLAYKSYLNKNENSVYALNNEIVTLITADRELAAFVLSLIGYTFSYEMLYEDLHKLSSAPLLKSTRILKMSELVNKGNSESAIVKHEDPENEVIEKVHEEIGKKDTVKSIPSDSSDITGIKNQENITNESISSIDVISETIMIYENQNNELECQKEESTADGITENINLSESNTFLMSNSEMELLTVESFKSFISKELTKNKPKQKIWLDLLEEYFPSKYDIISLDNLLNILDKFPDLKEKILKTKKDKEVLKSFFDLNK